MSGYSTRSTRMAGAHEAIKSIVTDSSLISSVNFGFGYWSSSYSRIYYNRRKQAERLLDVELYLKYLDGHGFIVITIGVVMQEFNGVIRDGVKTKLFLVLLKTV